MWTILHFTELICHVVGGSDRSLYEVLDYNGNKLTVELKCNEWMTVFTLCDSDLREAGLGSLPLQLPLKLKKLTTDGPKKSGRQPSDPLSTQ